MVPSNSLKKRIPPIVKLGTCADSHFADEAQTLSYKQFSLHQQTHLKSMLLSNNLVFWFWLLDKDKHPTTRQQFYEHLSNNFINASISLWVGFLQLQVPLSHDLLSHGSLAVSFIFMQSSSVLCFPSLSPFTLEGSSHWPASTHGVEKQLVLFLLLLKTWLGMRWVCILYHLTIYLRK